MSKFEVLNVSRDSHQAETVSVGSRSGVRRMNIPKPPMGGTTMEEFITRAARAFRDHLEAECFEWSVVCVEARAWMGMAIWRYPDGTEFVLRNQTCRTMEEAQKSLLSTLLCFDD